MARKQQSFCFINAISLRAREVTKVLQGSREDLDLLALLDPLCVPQMHFAPNKSSFSL